MRFFVAVVPWASLLDLWRNFYGMLENLSVLALILISGWVISRIVRWALYRFLRLIHFDRLTDRLGLTEGLSRAGVRREPAAAVSLAVSYLLFFIFLLLAARALESPALDSFIAQLFGYLPRLATALLILLVGYLGGAFVNRSVLIAAVNANLQSARTLALIAQSLVLVFFLAMALEQAGLGREIVISAFSILFGGAVLALALAFGLGGRKLARDFLERRLGKARPEHRRSSRRETIRHI